MSDGAWASISRTNRAVAKYVLLPIAALLTAFVTVRFLASYWWFDRYATTFTVTAPINVLETCTSDIIRSRYGDPVAQSPIFNPATFRCGLIETDAGYFALPKSGGSFIRDTRASMLRRLQQGGTYHAVYHSPLFAPDRDGKFRREDGQIAWVTPSPTLLRLQEVTE